MTLESVPNFTLVTRASLSLLMYYYNFRGFAPQLVINRMATLSRYKTFHITMPIHPSIELHSYIVFIALVWAKNVQLTANLDKLQVMSMAKCGL